MTGGSCEGMPSMMALAMPLFCMLSARGGTALAWWMLCLGSRRSYWATRFIVSVPVCIS